MEQIQPKPGRHAEVLLIRNVFSEAIVKAVIGIYKEAKLKFVRGKGKHFRCFVMDPARNAHAKASFQMSRDQAARHYVAFDAHVLEKKLCVLIEAHLRIALKAKFGKDFDIFLNCGGVNATQQMVRAGFSEHFDHNTFNTIIAFYEISIPQPDFSPWCQSVKLFRRIFHEVFFLDI